MAVDQGPTPLIIACQENDLKKIEEILNSDQQALVSSADKSGKVVMHYCAERGDLDVFKKIFDSDPSVMDKRDEDGYTPLTFAVIGGNGPVVDFLLEKGVDVNNVDAEKHSLVHWATVCGHAEILTKLLKKGSLPSTPDLHGAHALHYATQASTGLDPQTTTTSTSTTNFDVVELLKILLKHGANVNCTDFEERTPLLWAASCGNCAAVSALLEAGADKHSFDKDQLTALHCAASRGHGDVIRTICKTASDVQINTRDRNGSSPLFYAAALGHLDAVKALLEHEAITDLQDKKLRTPAHCAAAKGQLGTLKLLLQHGASFALENYRGDLAIHEAVQAGSLELIEWMLSIAPSYTNATNHDGRTPLHLAAALGHLDTCRLLVEKGAHKDALMLSKASCVTSLDLAEEKNHQDVVEYLRSVDAKRCVELTPASLVEEFKKHMATRKLATTKSPKKKSTAEMQAQTDETQKMDQAVTTAHDFSSSVSAAVGPKDNNELDADAQKSGSKKVKKSKKGHKHVKLVNGNEAGVDENGQKQNGDEAKNGLGENADEVGNAESKTTKSGVDDEADFFENGDRQIPAIDVEETTAVTKVNGVQEEAAPGATGVKEKKHSKRKSKSKDKETSKSNLKKETENGDILDSSRTSAGVSEIASVSLDEQEKEEKNQKKASKKKSKHVTTKKPEIADEKIDQIDNRQEIDTIDQLQNKRGDDEYSDFSGEGDAGDRKSDQSSERGGDGADDGNRKIKSTRIISGSGSDAASSGLGGGAIDRRSSAGFGANRSPGVIDRFRVDWESSLRSSVHRYAEEKRIFQELANLKRLQIQYGSVQEEVIVRRLIDDFLRGYNVRAGDFQVNTFNMWEKFLYDQLKILYRKEKESLLQSYESKVKNQTSLFEQKQAAAIGRRRGIEDRVDRLSRTYGIAPIPMQYSPRLYKPSFS